MKTTRIFFFAVVVFVLITVGACQTKTPALVEFQPEEGSLLKITFSYPPNWSWEKNINSDKAYEAIEALDPYPASDPGTGDSLRLVYLDVAVVSSPQVKMKESIDLHLEGIDVLDRLELLEDRTVQIDGYSARWLTIKNNYEDRSPNNIFFEEYIYLLVGDRYYTFILYIPEDERNGQFHVEFNAMIESIKILP